MGRVTIFLAPESPLHSPQLPFLEDNQLIAMATTAHPTELPTPHGGKLCTLIGDKDDIEKLKNEALGLPSIFLTKRQMCGASPPACPRGPNSPAHTIRALRRHRVPVQRCLLAAHGLPQRG